MNAGESIKAMLSFLEAENLCKKVNDGYFLGLLYTQMGDIYKNYYDYTRSLEMFKKATACYEQSGKDLHRLYSLVDQASAYKNLGKNDESYRLHQIVLDEGTRKGYRRLTELCLGDLTMLCLKMKKLDEADLFIRELQQHYDISAMSSSFLADVAEIHAIRKEWNLAQEVLQQAWQRAQTENDTIVLYFTEARIHEIRTPQSDIYYSMLEGLKKQAGSIRRSMEQPVLTAQRDYLSEKLEFEAYRLQMETRLRILYILLFFLVILIVVSLASRKLKKEKEKACKTIDELNREMQQKDQESRTRVDTLLQELETKDKETSASIHQLRNELKKQEENHHQYMVETEKFQHDLQDSMLEKSLRATGMFNESIFTMGEILMDFEHIKAPNTHLESIIKQWKKNYFVGNKALDNLERLVNEFHDEAMIHFRMEVSLPNKEDYRQVCYLFAGISVKTIAWLMDKNEGGLYKWRLRLRDKLESSDVEHKDLFINLLGK